MQTGKVYVHDSTMVYPYALLLFAGGELTVEHDKGLVTIGDGGWIKFRCSGRIPVVLKQLRRFFDLLLVSKINVRIRSADQRATSQTIAVCIRFC